MAPFLLVTKSSPPSGGGLKKADAFVGTRVVDRAHRGSYNHYLWNLADHQRGTCTPRGIRRRLALKIEGLARVSNFGQCPSPSLYTLHLLCLRNARAFPLLPAALASVSLWFALVRVRVARVSKHAEKTATRSDLGVRWKINWLGSMTGTDRQTKTS